MCATSNSYHVDTIGGLRELSLVIRTGQTDSRVAAWEEDAAQAELAKTAAPEYTDLPMHPIDRVAEIPRR